MSDKNENDEEELPELTFNEAKKMSVAELREEMKKRGINAKGSKKKLINRIRYYSGRGMYNKIIMEISISLCFPHGFKHIMSFIKIQSKQN